MLAGGQLAGSGLALLNKWFDVGNYRAATQRGKVDCAATKAIPVLVFFSGVRCAVCRSRLQALVTVRRAWQRLSAGQADRV